jgi:hypothetical protein
LVGKPEVKIPFRRLRPKWKDNIKIDIRELVQRVWVGLNWLRIGTGGRSVDVVMNI